MKTWFITGASSGLGKFVAENLLKTGDRVIAAVRNGRGLEELLAEHGDRLQVLTLDVTDRAAVRRQVDAAFAAVDRIDVVFSNAGYGLVGAAEEATDEQVERQLATNLIGPIDVVRAALPHLRRQGGGRIVQTSAAGGQAAYPGISIYCASKWGIEGFIDSVALEVASFGIDTIIIEPGPTSTGFGKGADLTKAIDAYEDTTVGQLRHAIEGDQFPFSGDPGRVAAAIVAAGHDAYPPRRLVLGGSGYADVEKALVERLNELRTNKGTSLAVDEA